MAGNRNLPEQRNQLLEDDHVPAYEILVERRCLGQTELKVKPGQVGTTNATKPDNLGVLDYAHLRVPLPKDLSNSGIFMKQANRKWPEAYFLMRRSTDGFISATGMFKAAFPWAQQEDEAAEKEYIKGLDDTSNEEVAGNVWIHPERAITLSEEYGIRTWIDALLDPEPITHGTSDPKKDIKSPPAYNKKSSMINGAGKTPKGGKRSTRGGKAAPPESPTKKTPGRKMATATPKRGKGRGKSDAETAESLEQVNGELQDSVKVEIESEARPTSGGDEVTHTKVNIEMPADNPDLELPEDAEGMLDKAREMVEEAEKISGPSTKRGKRKAAEVEDDDEGSSPAPTKRLKTTEVELRKEKIKRRALTGIIVSAAIGALVPTAISFAFGS